ncbi:hypothetical protein GCM10029978_114970 [Actinoallomurus acanthiterrae]
MLTSSSRCVRIDAIDLVSQERVGHRYVWDRIATVVLGAGGQATLPEREARAGRCDGSRTGSAG